MPGPASFRSSQLWGIKPFCLLLHSSCSFLQRQRSGKLTEHRLVLQFMSGLSSLQTHLSRRWSCGCTTDQFTYLVIQNTGSGLVETLPALRILMVSAMAEQRGVGLKAPEPVATLVPQLSRVTTPPEVVVVGVVGDEEHAGISLSLQLAAQGLRQQERKW